MAKLDTYRQHVMTTLEQHSQYNSPYGDIQRQLVLDIERDHYLLMTVGWIGKERHYGVTVHIDIKNERIWIEQDGTEVGIANELLELGIPKEDIILAFHAPYKRPYTGFGTGLEAEATA